MAKGVKPTTEELAKWDAALEEGMGFQHVAELYGVSKHTVAKYFPGKGWTKQQAREHGTFMKHHNAKMQKLVVV